jgi:Tfp pilus assembly protein PilF
MEVEGLKRFVSMALFCALSLIVSCATTENREENREVKATAFYKIGVAYLNENKIQQAYVEFHKAYELDPRNKEILNAIGYIYLIHLDKAEEAIEYFKKAVDVDPNYSDAFNNLGYAHEKSGNYETAISYYKKAISNPLYPTADKTYINLGSSYYRLRKYDDALVAFKEAIKRDPNFFLPYMKIALCYNALGKYGDASTAITQGITLDPGYKGDKEKAIEDLTLKKIKAIGYDEQDIRDYIEILKY